MMWDLDDVLYTFQCLDGTTVPWTIGNACEGTQIFGAPGSGKTSGSGRHLASAMLDRDFGGLVLSVKPSDVTDWERYAKTTRRSVTTLSTASGARFNFLAREFEYHQSKNRVATQSLVELFLTAMEGGHERGPSTDPYWDDALRQLLTNTIDLTSMASSSVRLADMVEIILSAPESRDAADSLSFRQSTFWKTLQGRRDPAQSIRSSMMPPAT